MFVGKILTGVWEEETIILKGMPKEFVLSARELVVLEIDEYEKLVKFLKDALPHIECKNNSQSGLITAIGEYLEQALKEKP